jgi:hypothetical protein
VAAGGASATDIRPGEIVSPSRRVYVLALIGVGGVAAVVALVVAVYLLFQEVVGGTVGAETLRRMRFAIEVLLTAPVIAGYHWSVRRADLEHPTGGPPGPRFVLLVGPPDRGVAREVARRTRGRVQAWARTDDGAGSWSAEEVLGALGDTTAAEVIVLADGSGLRIIPVHRG